MDIYIAIIDTIILLILLTRRTTTSERVLETRAKPRVLPEDLKRIKKAVANVRGELSAPKIIAAAGWEENDSRAQILVGRALRSMGFEARRVGKKGKDRRWVFVQEQL